MNIFEALSSDHRKLEPLLDDLVTATKLESGTKQLLDQVRDLLVPHSRAEEAVFYNTLRGIDSTKDIVAHSYREHLEAETLLRTLRALEKINIEWTNAAKKLRDALAHHIHEEETKVFDAAKQVIFDEEANQMALAFAQMKQKAMEQGDFKNTMDMIANMMPKRFADRTRQFDAAQTFGRQ